MENFYAVDAFVNYGLLNTRLTNFSNRTGFNIHQRNGQRYYGPPPFWKGPPPVQGSEVFVGHLPPDCFEDELIPVLESVAGIYEVRLLMNFTGFNRGYAFATYFNPQDAWKCVLALNKFEIRPGHKLNIMISTDNRRLFFGGVPQNKSKVEIWKELLPILPDMRNIIIFPQINDRSKNRGFMFVEFDSHRSAAIAKKSLITVPLKLWGADIIVDWAHPEPDIKPSIMFMVKKLFIRNIPPFLNEFTIKEILRDIVPVSAVTRIYLAGHYGFIHFHTREYAHLAMIRLSSLRFDHEQALDIQWGRPKRFEKKKQPTIPPRFRRESIPENQESKEPNGSLEPAPGTSAG